VIIDWSSELPYFGLRPIVRQWVIPGGAIVATARGNIDYDQLRVSARHGIGQQLQMFGGGAITAGHMAMFDAAGNVVDSGLLASATPYLITWGIGIGTPATTGTDVTPHYVVAQSGTLAGITISAKTAPAGADLIIDILDGGISVLGASHLHLPSGMGVASSASFANSPQTITVGDVLTLNILQVGSSIPGQDILVQLKVVPT
jgi:hypothetical protein